MLAIRTRISPASNLRPCRMAARYDDVTRFTNYDYALTAEANHIQAANAMHKFISATRPNDRLTAVKTLTHASFEGDFYHVAAQPAAEAYDPFVG